MNNSAELNEKSAQILDVIKEAKSILLHCHPAPDPDSIGSALAMSFALEQMGKKATVIRGDSEIPQGFMHFPGATGILPHNYLEIDPSRFDLFIILDSARIEMVSRRGRVVFPETMKTVIIDHHQSNDRYAEINLVDSSYPANCQLIYDLFVSWNIRITPEIAANIFIGIYADTGGFKYRGITPHTFEIAARLAELIPDVSDLVTRMENSNTFGFLEFQGHSLTSIEEYLDGRFALSSVSYGVIKEADIPAAEVRTSEVSSYLLTVPKWDFVASMVEIEPNKCKFSFRSRDEKKFDVAKLAETMGGGGHKAASGLILQMPFEEAKKMVVAKAKELYNL